MQGKGFHFSLCAVGNHWRAFAGVEAGGNGNNLVYILDLFFHAETGL